MSDKIRKYVLPNLPYLFVFWFFSKIGTAYRIAPGTDFGTKLMGMLDTFPKAFETYWPGLGGIDLLVGLAGAAGVYLLIQSKIRQAKKFRRDAEYGTARFGTKEDIKPFVDPKFQNNVILTGTEFLTMNTRPKIPANARNLNACVIGSSGSGKTTLLRCLNFLETADAGQLVFDGESFDLAHASRADIARLRKKTAFVFQNYNLFRNKTALQNVTEGLIVARKLPKEQADEIGMKMLAKVGLADRADYYPRQLSGGQQQRVAIARALAADPEIIYFDEPTSALDPELTGEVLSVMRQLAEEGMTMLVVTHEMGFARNVSSKTVFMENGVVVEQAPSQQFFASPKEERTRAFLRRIAHTE